MIKILFVTVTIWGSGEVSYEALPVIAGSTKEAIETCNAVKRQKEFTYVETDPQKVITGWYCEVGK